MPSEEDVKEFQAIYKAYYGKEISYKDASVEARKLFSFVQGVYDHMRQPEAQALLRCVLEEERVQKEKNDRDNEQQVGCSPLESAVI